MSWQPPSTDEKYVTVGNPPFGYRAWQALAFVNRAAVFSDYVAMILPMAFQSEGKGSPKHRVRGAELIQSKPLPNDSFVDEYGRSVKINALWQVWRRGVNRRRPAKTCNDWLDLFTVDTRKERLCGQTRLDEADWFLQRTFFGEPPKLVRNFKDVLYGCGYGIVLRKNKRGLTRLLNKTDWSKYSNLAMHNCRHISMCHIRQAIMDGGYSDVRHE